jgi:hypothetical protein
MEMIGNIHLPHPFSSLKILDETNVLGCVLNFFTHELPPASWFGYGGPD